MLQRGHGAVYSRLRPAISREALVDSVDAASLLREKLKLPEWAGSISALEVNGSESIVVRVQRRYASKLRNVPRTFEGYPVIVQIDLTMVAH
jgi:hypothetical protein